MVLDIYYIYIYIVIVSIVTVFVLPAEIRELDKKKNENKIGVFILTIALTVLIGGRPISYVFGDTPNYVDSMQRGSFIGAPIAWDTNYIFQSLMAYLSIVDASPRTLLMILAIINFGFTYVAMRKLFPNNTMLAMLVFFGAFSTFGAATNGLKAGCAASLFLMAVAYKEKRLVSFFFLFLSVGFHHSMQLPVVAYIACAFYKNTKVYLVIWVICLILAISHNTSFMSLFANFTDERGVGYLLVQAGSLDSVYGGKIGFRIDFVLYSAVPIVIGYIALFKKKIQSVEYRFIYNVYLLINSIWLLCMYASYTNRIAYLSWLLYPVLILYPTLQPDWGTGRKKTLGYLVLGHLAFTLFMYFIYY